MKQKYHIRVTKSGFAAAGVVSELLDYCKPTNLSISIDTRIIKEKTGLACSFVVNDFAVVGYGIELINQRDLVLVNQGRARFRANKSILGAGTGLGKCIMRWDKHVSRYVPIPSEGGHADFTPHDQLELDLTKYIQDIEAWTCPVSWEDLLSGFGIQRIYQFFLSRNDHAPSADAIGNRGPLPDEIFARRREDEHAWHTFVLYTKIYARCAKNFALDSLALGGVYIAGGIAAKNIPMFELDIFMKEFVSCGKQRDLLKAVPIYVIADYNVSLYGVVRYMQLESLC